MITSSQSWSLVAVARARRQLTAMKEPFSSVDEEVVVVVVDDDEAVSICSGLQYDSLSSSAGVEVKVEVEEDEEGEVEGEGDAAVVFAVAAFSLIVSMRMNSFSSSSSSSSVMRFSSQASMPAFFSIGDRLARSCR